LVRFDLVMSDNNPIIITSEGQLHQAVGNALSKYAQIEFALASVLRNLLKIDFLQSHTLLFAIQNYRTRLTTLSELLEARFGKSVTKYWDSCSEALQKLAQFRNALAHWHASATYILGAKEDDAGKLEYKLSPPAPGDMRVVRTADIEKFTTDCWSMLRLLNDLASTVKRKRRPPLPKRFGRSITYQIQACLRPPPKPKEPGHRRPPSRPKLSRAQKRAKALKDARLKAAKKS
jgi:hypothetical protein